MFDLPAIRNTNRIEDLQKSATETQAAEWRRASFETSGPMLKHVVRRDDVRSQTSMERE